MLSFRQKLEQSWYQPKASLLWYLYPLMLLYAFLSAIRRFIYRHSLLPRQRVPVPLIVVGNISIGGTGKTPLVIALVNHLKDKGLNPGVVSRGYGGQTDFYPLLVNGHVPPAESGDEAALIFKRTLVPVVVDPDRMRAARLLVFDADCDVIVSDDGLQHLAMARDVEIVVVDGSRGFGNGHLLPLGPLRENVKRLESVDLLVLNVNDDHHAGNLEETLDSSRLSEMRLLPAELTPLSNTPYHLMPVLGDTVHAVAGIGNPERFFTTLESLGFKLKKHAFGDHHDFRAADLAFDDGHAVVMTEKDAVKCQGFDQGNLWYLPVEAELSDNFFTHIDRLLKINENALDKRKDYARQETA